MTCSGEEREFRDVEELREVLKAITDFLKELGPLLSELLREVMETLSGERIGENVAAFYRKLKESGMPDEVVVELTRKYYEDLMILDELVGRFMGKLGEGKAWAEKWKEWSVGGGEGS